MSEFKEWSNKTWWSAVLAAVLSMTLCSCMINEIPVLQSWGALLFAVVWSVCIGYVVGTGLHEKQLIAEYVGFYKKWKERKQC